MTTANTTIVIQVGSKVYLFFGRSAKIHIFLVYCRILVISLCVLWDEKGWQSLSWTDDSILNLLFWLSMPVLQEKVLVSVWLQTLHLLTNGLLPRVQKRRTCVNQRKEIFFDWKWNYFKVGSNKNITDKSFYVRPDFKSQLLFWGFF